jgi:solute carrier family 25 folate transporter 32
MEEKYNHGDKRPDISNSGVILASMGSKFVATCLTYPHEVVRTRLITQTRQSDQPLKYRSILGTIKTIVKEESWRGLYKGLGINLIRTIPATAISLLTYEVLIKAWN